MTDDEAQELAEYASMLVALDKPSLIEICVNQYEDLQKLSMKVENALLQIRAKKGGSA